MQALEEEEKMTPEQLAIKNVGKLDPKRHLEEKVIQLCQFCSVVDPNTLNLDPYPDFWPNLDPDPRAML